jgi:hypothetical protein
METELRILTARLLTRRSLPRTDPLARRALVDDGFRHALDQRLAGVGLQMLDNPYAAHVAVGLTQDMLEPVFGEGREYSASNVGLMRDELAWLMVIWSLIILPKRERQVSRRKLLDEGQDDMFGAEQPVEHGDAVSGALSEASLLADFGTRLGGKMKLNIALGKLARLGFIERRGGQVLEGPLLDVLLDYRILADRVIHGTLADVLTGAGHRMPDANAFELAQAADEALEDGE